MITLLASAPMGWPAASLIMAGLLMLTALFWRILQIR